jgi:hypothetical protein
MSEIAGRVRIRKRLRGMLLEGKVLGEAHSAA